MRLGHILTIVFAALWLGPAALAAPDGFGVDYLAGPAWRAQIEKAREQATGSAWMDLFRKPGYGAVVVRRTKPGRAEVHTALTDVWYVIDGAGTLITGGKLVDGKNTESGELRGSSINGGAAHHIAKGDVLDIPAGVPHWVSRVDGKELVYLTVKISTPER